MLSTAPHLHLAFFPASSAFQGYCLPHESHENVAPPAIIASDVESTIELIKDAKCYQNNLQAARAFIASAGGQTTISRPHTLPAAGPARPAGRSPARQ